MLREQGLSVPTPNPNPTITIQNGAKLQPALSAIFPIVGPTAAPHFRIRRGTAVVHLCKEVV